MLSSKILEVQTLRFYVVPSHALLRRSVAAVTIHSWLQCSTDATSKPACHIHSPSLHSWDWNLISEHFIYFYFSFRNVFTPVITSWTEVTGSGTWLITSLHCQKTFAYGWRDWVKVGCLLQPCLTTPWQCGIAQQHPLPPLTCLLAGLLQEPVPEDWMEREELEVRGKDKDRGFYMLLLLTWQIFWLLSASVRSNQEA